MDATKVLVGTLGSDILELSAVEMPKNPDGEAPTDTGPREGGGSGVQPVTLFLKDRMNTILCPSWGYVAVESLLPVSRR